MPKTTTPADKQALLAKMDRDRRELADAFARAVPADSPAKGWGTATALTAGAMLGWPSFLKQPLRAMAAVAVRDRLAALLRRRHVRRASGALPDADVAQLAKLAADLRVAAAGSADPGEVERLRAQLDEHVRRLRALRAAGASEPPVP